MFVIVLVQINVASKPNNDITSQHSWSISIILSLSPLAGRLGGILVVREGV